MLLRELFRKVHTQESIIAMQNFSVLALNDLGERITMLSCVILICLFVGSAWAMNPIPRNDTGYQKLRNFSKIQIMRNFDQSGGLGRALRQDVKKFLTADQLWSLHI